MPRYICALTGKQTLDPVISPAGYVFDRTTIEQHLAFDSTCPKTSAPLLKSELIPIVGPKGPEKQARKRMIANADTAVIDNSVIPDPLAMVVAVVCSTFTGSVLAVALFFKSLDFLILNLMPSLAFFWGLAAAIFPSWTISVLELSSSENAVELTGAVVALASYGVLKVGFSGCSATKKKMLPLLSLVFFVVAKSPLVIDEATLSSASLPLCGWCTVPQFAAAVPLLMAFGHSRAPAIKEYLEANQKAAVKLADQVREEGHFHVGGK